MDIINYDTQPAQPTTSTFRVEERTIDVHAAPDHDNLVNATLTARDVRSAPDREGGWQVFHAAVREDPDKYKSGSGIRLVLVGGDR